MKKRIRDIAQIGIGYPFRGKVPAVEAGNVRVVQIKDLDEKRRLDSAGLVTINFERPEPYLVEHGDVLFLARGHRLVAVTVDRPPPHTIAAGYFLILRPHAKIVTPDYLTWWLNGLEFQECLRPFVQGTHMPLVSKREFQDLPIHLPPMEVQHRILTLNNLADRERCLADAVLAKRAELVQEVARRLMGRSPKTKDK
jgi:Type I restriction modification DNA specificity domain